MNSQITRELLAYFLSGVVHVGVVGSWLVLDTRPPVTYATDQGRASIALNASIAASPDGQWTPEVELLTFEVEKPRVEEPKPVKLAVKPPVPLELDKQLELPKEKGERKATMPGAKPDAEPEKEPEKVEPPPKPPEKKKPVPQKITRDTEIASINSPASTASQAASGGEIELPRKHATNPQIPYPSDAYAAGQQGVVQLLVTVSHTGTVAAVRVETSSGFPSLDNAAIVGVRNWRFEPARRLGLTVEQNVILPVRFSIITRQ